MTGFEPWTSGVGSNRSTDGATYNYHFMARDLNPKPETIARPPS